MREQKEGQKGKGEEKNEETGRTKENWSPNPQNEDRISEKQNVGKGRKE